MDALQYARELIAFDSVSRRSNEPISQAVSCHLERLGFDIEQLSYLDSRGVKKVSLVAKRGSGLGGIAYFSHTDVVPADDWSFPHGTPFEGTLHGDRLYGRGSCDMKGSLAAALAAAERLDPTSQRYPLYIVCTADEEVGMGGARQVNRESKYFEEMVQGKTVGIIGEPTELRIVHAHKGAYGIDLTSRGRSAHSSTRDGLNANWQLIPLLPELAQLRELSESSERWMNSRFDPPTLSLNMILINEPAATNITPSLARATIFFRPMPEVPWRELVEQIEAKAKHYGIEVSTRYGVDPLWVDPDSPFVIDMLQLAKQSKPEVVCYATDGGVLKRLESLVVCGPGSIEQAHRADEWISLEQLKLGTEFYLSAFQKWTA